ncbi:MAG TPA: class I adenylate-forming enzyme family protein [Xanthobacteraceae bacterium]|jgi:acyl-CoA synthetase (AMP-forming)/AMP-acid ligase II|nr:class I adenylate-forming enzyme family protein [Xanthobacteraceae bacterium]
MIPKETRKETPEAMLSRDFGTLPALIRRYAEVAPERIAFKLNAQSLSYAVLDRLMDRTASAFQRGGARQGDVIAICAATSLEYLAVFLGALRAGLVVAPLSPSAAPESLRLMLRDSGASHFFLDAKTREVLQGEVPPNIECVALDHSAAGTKFADWLAPEDATPADITAMPEEPFNIIYSSGTTGAPKGIVQPNSMRWAHVRRGMHYGYGAGTVSLASTPLYSNTTLVAIFPTIACGGTVVLMAKFGVAEFLALAERERVTHAMLVPAQYQRIIGHPDFDKYDLSSFRMKFATSSPFPAALKAEVLRRWPGGLIDSYGLTEGGGTCVLVAHEFPQKLHTVGTPAPGHDIRLIDEDGREVGKGEAGEVVGRSAVMMTGYHRQPELTAASEWRDAEGCRFIRTGDIGRFDEDGFLTLIDRKKDMIISGGFNIYPSDLEAALAQHGAVAEAAVVGAPSERWGETPVAFVVLKAESVATGEELRAWANEKLGRMQRLAEVRIKDALPRSPIGKVLKRELREELLRSSAGHSRTPAA